MNASQTATIYALSDPDRKDVIRYVGCTTTSLGERLNHHLYDRPSKRKKEWFRNLKQFGRKPVIWALEVTDSASAKSKEDWWIRILQGQGHLINVCSLGKMRRKRPQVGNTKITASDITGIRDAYRDGATCVEIAAVRGLNPATIRSVVKRITWRHIK